MGRFIDLTGQTFEKWKVLYRTTNKGSVTYWCCECECGTIKDVSSEDLRKGKTKSCGCSKSEYMSIARKRYNRYDLSGEYGVGYTYNTNKPFYFDKEDYDKIKNYCWIESHLHIKEQYHYIISTTRDGHTYMLSRIVMGLTDKNLVVDHINHDVTDNRKDNLRIGNYSQNSWNTNTSNKNTSGFRGVYWCEELQAYRAYIQENKNRHWLGVFKVFEDAVRARLEAEEKYYGEWKYKDCV